VAGDWDCDGSQEPVLLRADGTVWRWPSVDGQPQLVGTAAAGTGIAAERDGGGCDLAVVRDRQGAVTPVVAADRR
jgi:hypothetical protein